ncbi:MAG: flagellar motor protein MotB [Thermoguttaceae bacterium]
MEKKCPPEGAPEWVLTYGDMMSLLLTFFIMLYAMSTVDKPKQDVIADALQTQFGYSQTQVPVPGVQNPANSNKQRLQAIGRARRMQLMRGGNPVISPQGDYAKVRTVVSARGDTVRGGIVYFDLDSDRLTDEAKNDIRTIADQLRGSPNKIEIKGHTSNEQGIYANDLYDLGYVRAKAVRDELIKLGVDGKSIRVTTAGPDEPVSSDIRTPGRTPHQANAYAEVYRLQELTKEFEGDKLKRDVRE